MIQRLSERDQANLDIARTQCPIKTWNRLWQRSGNTNPFSRWPGLLATPSDPHRLLRVDQRYVTTLGISMKQAKRFGVRYFRSNNSDWIQAGHLLVDRTKVTTDCYEQLAAQVKSLPGSFVYLDWQTDTVQTNRLLDTLQLNGMIVHSRLHMKSGLIRLVNESFDEYFGGLSKSFRKKVRSSMKKLLATSEVKYRCTDKFQTGDDGQVFATENGQELGRLLQRLFDVEQLGWKGQAGSSFNDHPEAKSQVVEQCLLAAKSGHLQIHTLTVGDTIAAFDLGFVNGETYFSYKVSYDPQFAKFSPGQLLTYEQLQHWFAEGSIKLVDMVGELNEATGKWCNDSVNRYRYLISTGGFCSNMALRCYALGRTSLKKILRRGA